MTICIVICVLLAIFIALLFLKKKLQRDLALAKGGCEELPWKDFFVILFVLCSLFFMGWKPKKDDPWEDW